MTPLEYLARLDAELAELERLASPPNFQRFVSRRSDLRDRVRKLRVMADGLRSLLPRDA